VSANNANGVGDYSGDGLDDLLGSNGFSLETALSNGSALSNTVGISGESGDPTQFVSIDIDGDGFVDSVGLNARTQDVSVLLSNGIGGFLRPQHFDSKGAGARLAVVDWNGDQIPDLVIVTVDGATAVVLEGQ